MNKTIPSFLLVLATLCFTSRLVADTTTAETPTAPDEPMSIWFKREANSYHRSLPIGNGRLGAMDLGGVLRQRIVLNESSMWSGGPYDGNRYDAYKCLPKVRELLFEGKVAQANKLLGQHFKYADGVEGWKNIDQFGCYQILGDLYLDFEYGESVDRIKVTSPSGHEQGDGQSLVNSYDKDKKTCLLYTSPSPRDS